MPIHKINKLMLIALASIGTMGLAAEKMMAETEKAYFAGGCFWCLEHPFDSIPGVTEVMPGYGGGQTKNPTYQEVCSGTTGHYEMVRVSYDPSRVTYRELVDIFWRQIDPTDGGGQFADRGSQYRPAIFYQTSEERDIALGSKKALERSGKFSKPLAVQILPFTSFYPAEEYHQKYYRKCPAQYQRYRTFSGRADYLERVWKKEESKMKYTKPDKKELKKKLTDLQYRVTQEGDTEMPFANEYWQEKREGIYVDVVTGQPLFSSRDKFDSGSGWPSFTRPLDRDLVVENEDRALGLKRVEVRSRLGDSHLGHVFDDGPQPTGRRYCINSAALRFIPREKMAAEGYGDFLYLFEDKK